MGYINWKKAKARNLEEAFRLCKDYAEFANSNRLNIERLAELMGDGDETLRKWIRKATMPTHKIPSFEHACGCSYVSDYLAARTGKMLIDIPTGRKLKSTDVLQTQRMFNKSMELLIEFASGESTAEETSAALHASMCDLAYHNENVQKLKSPELDFEAENE